MYLICFWMKWVIVYTDGFTVLGCMTALKTVHYAISLLWGAKCCYFVSFQSLKAKTDLNFQYLLNVLAALVSTLFFHSLYHVQQTGPAAWVIIHSPFITFVGHKVMFILTSKAILATRKGSNKSLWLYKKNCIQL